MKQYNFKIQWLLTFENFRKVFFILGINGLDKIYIRDNDLNIIDTVENKKSLEEVLGYITRVHFNKLGDNFYVEVVKK